MQPQEEQKNIKAFSFGLLGIVLGIGFSSVVKYFNLEVIELILVYMGGVSIFIIAIITLFSIRK